MWRFMTSSYWRKEDVLSRSSSCINTRDNGFLCPIVNTCIDHQNSICKAGYDNNSLKRLYPTYKEYLILNYCSITQMSFANIWLSTKYFIPWREVSINQSLNAFLTTSFLESMFLKNLGGLLFFSMFESMCKWKVWRTFYISMICYGAIATTWNYAVEIPWPWDKLLKVAINGHWLIIWHWAGH